MTDVAFVAWVAEAGEGVSSLNPSGLASSGTDRHLSAFAASYGASVADPTNVRFPATTNSGGSAATKHGSTVIVPNMSGLAKASSWALTAPSATTGALFADWAASQDAAVIAGAVFENVDQSSPYGTRVENDSVSASGAEPVIASTNGVAGDMWHIMFWGYYGGGSNGGTANVTVNAIPIDIGHFQTRDNYNDGEFSSTSMVFCHAYVPVTSSGALMTMAFVQSQPLDAWYAIGELIKQVGGGGGGSSIAPISHYFHRMRRANG